MNNYLDSLEERMKGASSCKALSEAAAEAMASLQQGIDDAKAQAEKLAELMVPPTDLVTTIMWIKKQIESYAIPYQVYLEQLALYTEKLAKIEQLLSDKARELACREE